MLTPADQQLLGRACMRMRSRSGNDRVHEHREIGASGQVVSRVAARIGEVRFGDQPCTQVAASRETHDAHATRRGATRNGLTAQQPQSPHGVMHGGVGARSPTVSRQSIAQNGGGEASRREPLGGFDSFLVDDHAHIAATRDDEQRDAVVSNLGSVEREQRPRDVLREAVPHWAIRQALDDFFVHRDLVRSGCPTGPQCQASIRQKRPVRPQRQG